MHLTSVDSLFTAYSPNVNCAVDGQVVDTSGPEGSADLALKDGPNATKDPDATNTKASDATKASHAPKVSVAPKASIAPKASTAFKAPTTRKASDAAKAPDATEASDAPGAATKVLFSILLTIPYQTFV